jgi:lysophospholipase L1-like esterase
MQDNNSVKKENIELKKALLESNGNCKKCNNAERQHVNVRTSENTLVVGSSMLRNITDSFKVENVEIIPISGAHVPRIKAEIRSKKHKNKYQQVCVVVGGNDVESPKEIDAIINDFDELISETKDASEHVTIASIFPRKGGPMLQDKIDETNVKLAELCLQKSCKFVDTNGSFKMLDGKRNDALYKKDGVHLNKQGNEKLLSNLGLVYSEKTYADIVTNKASPIKLKSRTSTHQSSSQTEDWQTVSNRRYKEHTRSKEPRCFFCGIPGHMKQQCRHGRPLQCRKCEKYGHKARVCELF